MTEGQPSDYESFATLRAAQEGLEKLGYYFFPLSKEHVEAGVTEPLVHRVRTQVKKRGMEKVAGKVALTFSGYAQDPREIFMISEVRSYWQKLNRELPELPAVLAYLPQMAFNGPGIHLMLLGDVEATERPELGVYDVHVQDADTLVEDALRRIGQASRTYRLNPNFTQQLMAQFVAGATHHDLTRP